MYINKEIWKDVVGFEDNYMISNVGRIKRKESLFVRTDGVVRAFKEKMLAMSINKGYLFAHLQKTGVGKKYPIHRVVAQAFIPNYENKPCVNHINGDPSDNRVENLEWCSFAENSYHSRHILGKDTGIQNKKPIICLNTNKEYGSIREAAKYHGISPSNIQNVLRGVSKHTGGLVFNYK